MKSGIDISGQHTELEVRLLEYVALNFLRAHRWSARSEDVFQNWLNGEDGMLAPYARRIYAFVVANAEQEGD